MVLKRVNPFQYTRYGTSNIKCDDLVQTGLYIFNKPLECTCLYKSIPLRCKSAGRVGDEESEDAAELGWVNKSLTYNSSYY